MQEKLLYIDVDFHKEYLGGDKNRSQFLWKSLSLNYKSDLLLINSQDITKSKETLQEYYPKVNAIYFLNSRRNYFYESSIILSFSKKKLKVLKGILQAKNYKIIFCRFTSMGKLALFSSKILEKSSIVIDIDMLSSKLAKLSWNKSKTFGNRFFFIENKWLNNFENKLFKEDFLFLFSNFKEAQRTYKKASQFNPIPGKFVTINNTLPIIKSNFIKENNHQSIRKILFFGSLNSIANQDAFLFLMKDIYPLISNTLEKEKVIIEIIGKNPTKIYQFYQDYFNVNIIGEVSNLYQEIKAAFLILLPLRIGSGTRTRILECGLLKKVVVTTSIGMEGLKLSKEELIIENKAEKIAEKIKDLLSNKIERNKISENLYQQCLRFYHPLKVKEELLEAITKFKKLSIIHVLRRISFKEWGGTENVVWHLSQEQKQGYNIEILGTKALASNIYEEKIDVFIKRFSYFYSYLFLSNKEKSILDKKGGNPFSYSMFKYLLKKRNIKMIHSHTMGRITGMIKVIAYLKRIPFVVSLHGGHYDVPEIEKQTMKKAIKNPFKYGRIVDKLLGIKGDNYLRKSNGMICVGKNEEKIAKETLPFQSIKYIPNGVNIALFKQKINIDLKDYLQINKQKKLLLCVARIDYQKNQIILLELLQELNKVSKGSVHLLLIGAISCEKYYQKIQAKIKEYNLFQDISIIPGLSFNDEKLIKAYQIADCFILPSLHEPFGITILEAWAAKLPVIAAKVGGNTIYYRK